MSSGLRQLHLIGAIGGFIAVVGGIFNLVAYTSYVSAEFLILLNMFLIGSNGLIATYFFGAMSATRDSVIKVGSLIAGMGLVFNILIAIIQMAGFTSYALAIIGALVMITGIVMVCIKFMMLFSRDTYILLFCIFIFMGLLFSLFWSWASMITGAGLGGMLIYFYTHHITY